MGKALSIVGGILALLGTFVFSWSIFITAPTSGFGVFINFSDILDILNTLTGSDAAIGWICFILLILTTISGIMILIGAKVKGLAIFFGLIATVMGILMILTHLFDLGDLDMFIFEFLFFGVTDFIVPDMIPYILELGSTGVYLGQVVLLAGGLLGLIGGITTKKD